MSAAALYRRPSGIAAQGRGAVLAVSLLLLVVMTILGIATSHVFRMQAQSATSARDRNLAFQAAEAGLRRAERWLNSVDDVAAPIACMIEKCSVYAPGGISEDAIRNPLTESGDKWWRTYGWEHQEGDFVEADRADGSDYATSRSTRFVIEEYDEILDSLTISPSGPPPRRIVYRISSAAQAGKSRSVAVLQSSFVRRFE